MIPRGTLPRTIGRFTWHRFVVGSALIALTPLLGACPPAPPPPPATASPNHLCFAPEVTFSPPRIDGVVGAGDAGWIDSFRYLFENGSSVADVIVQGVRDNNYVYLSFEVNNDQSYDEQDAVLLVFSPGGGANNDRRIIIHPLFTTGAGSDGKPNDVLYSNDSGNWNSVSPIPVAWLKDSNNNPNDDNVRVSTNGQSWAVEMRIPITTTPANTANPAADTGINFPASGAFGMYFNVIKVQSGPNNSLQGSERAWPNGTVLSGNPPNNIFQLEVHTPPSTAAQPWGTGARTGTTCNGVNVSTADFYVEHPTLPGANLNTVVMNEPNIYAVRPTNSTVDAAGVFQPAQGIDAKFFFNDWGLGSPADATLVPQDATNPGGTNPTTPRQTIPAATALEQGGATLRAGRWTPTQSQSVCSSVELSSNVPGTTFVNHRGYNNLSFVVASSPFEYPATISSRGYKLPDGARAHDFTLRTYTYGTPREAAWTTEIRVGEERTGKPLNRVDNMYSLQLEPDTKLAISTRITPPEIRIPSEDLRVPPGTSGTRPLTATVIPGGLVTVYAQGAVQLRKQRDGAFALPATPSGVQAPKEREADSYLLSAPHAPATRVGALVGSWDGFKTSFPIGHARTLRVPADAKRLFLAINDSPTGYAEHSGTGFEVQVSASPLERHFAQTDSATSLEAGRTRKTVPLGANLPTWLMCGQRNTGRKLLIKGKTVDLMEDTQCFSYIVRKIGAR